MPRSLETVHSELVRVAEEMGFNPRSREFTRTRFLQHGMGPSYTEGTPTEVTKHDLETYGGFTRLKQDAAHVEGIPSHVQLAQARGVDLRNNYVRKLERDLSTVDYFTARIEDNLAEVFTNHPIVVPVSKFASSKKKVQKTVTLLWSDLHFGVDVQPYEVYGAQYNWTVAARRLAILCKEAINWQEDLSDVKLRVVLNGDIMQGVIHLNDINIKPMTEQIWGAASLLIHALSFLREHYSSIEVVCLPGNHDRMTYRDNNRQLCQRWDSHAHSLYLALMMAFRTDSRITFDIPTTGMALMDDMNGGYIIASHGDVEPDPKNVSKKINTEALALKLLKLTESNAVDKRVTVALFGHWHTPTVQMLPTGSFVVVNGCLIGSEPFGQHAIGEFNNQPAQIMFESCEGCPIAKLMVVKVMTADTNADLDLIIPTPRIREEGQLVV